MVEFEQDRKIEKEIYAALNFLRLLSQAIAAEEFEMPENVFFNIGGVESINSLIIDCKEERIDIFNNSIGELFKKLRENIEYFKKVTVSTGALMEKANKEFESFNEFFSEESGINSIAFDDLMTFDFIPMDKRTEITECRPKSKKIGER